MSYRFVDVAKPAIGIAGQRTQSSEVLAGFSQVLKKSRNNKMFNRCLVLRQSVGLSYTGLEAAMNLHFLRNKLCIRDKQTITILDLPPDSRLD